QFFLDLSGKSVYETEADASETVTEEPFITDIREGTAVNLAETEEELTDLSEQLGLETVIPAFIVSELTRAFQMGFLLFIPFLVIDIVISSTLMAMGMMMLPPSMISMPFKIMLFVLVDGWKLLVGTVVQSFNA
ncbi:MAG: EscR/YscR/HrcR family type III secretion system export apparatus protein, partial [Ruminiclostridium sp.]|nr:EscR/YscR/HrcR family type III secretion system export apparatus protein [Ruminiclostridium sp.]